MYQEDVDKLCCVFNNYQLILFINIEYNHTILFTFLCTKKNEEIKVFRLLLLAIYVNNLQNNLIIFTSYLRVRQGETL